MIYRTIRNQNFIFFLVFSLTVSSARAKVNNDQPIMGNPPVHHFTHVDYNSDSQFWTACQDSLGVMYFGNNYGILRFDGERWDRCQLSNNSSVRSLFQASDGTIYAGGFNELGIIEDHDNGDFSYRSLINNIPEGFRDFGNIWQILEVKETVIFQSFDYLYLLKDNHFEVIEPSGTFGYANTCQNKLFIEDQQHIFTFDPESSRFTPFLQGEQLNNEEILEILPGNTEETLWIISKEGSVFTADINTGNIQNHQKLDQPSTNKIYTSAIRSSSGELYAGTLSHHLWVWEFKDEKFIKKRSYPNLQDQTVLNLFEAKEETIWILLNKALDYLDPNAHLISVFQGPSVYDAVYFRDRLYVATNQGVFRSGVYSKERDAVKPGFSKITGLEGQAWSLHVIDETLFCAHDRGLFRISDDHQVARTGPFSGVWKLHPVSENSHKYFVCTYDGFGLISSDSSGTKILKEKIDGFNQSTRDIMAVENKPQAYWICHGYKGVFRVKLNDTRTRVTSTEHFTEQHGLPSPFNINVHRWQDEIVFSTNEGLFSFDEPSGKFIKHKDLTGLLGDEENIRKLKEQGDTTWCVIDDQIGFFNHRKMDRVITNPFLSLKGLLNEGMECIVPLSRSREVLLGTTNGLFAYKPEEPGPADKGKKVQTRIRTVTYSMDDSSKTRITAGPHDHLTFPNEAFNIHFRFSAPLIRDKKNIRYAYRLEGQMEEWSNWQEDPGVTFSFLKSGDYTLHVKARSLAGETAEEYLTHFVIEPPWYATWPWIIFWTAMAFLMVFSIFKQTQKLILKEKEKTRQEEKELQKARETKRENEIISLEKERIEAENIEKSKDLTNNAMLIAGKRELLIDIQSKLNDLRKNAKNDIVRSEILNIVRNIQLNLNDEKQNQLFDTNLERVHQQLFDELKQRYPSITAREMRLCAFIKMELTNKEMASIFSISERGVETARYRLKKKYPDIHELIGHP